MSLRRAGSPTTMNLPDVVTRQEWLAARKALLAKEKELTRARDALAADRRRLPMVKVDKEYLFEGPEGMVTLPDLFDGRGQLIVDHAMWLWDVTADGDETPRDVGCPSCSARLDNIGHLAHLRARDTNLVVVSRAPYAKIAPFKKRMGWTFPWYSSAGSDFNYDFHATMDDRVAPVLLNYRDEDELDWSPARRGDYPGISAFLRAGDEVFHTYSTFARGIEQPGGTHYYLDLTALGRQEAWEQPPGRATAFGAPAGSPNVRYHDEYEDH
jgi:predicted dithiol-disulfide oxidoreductase (DUF899 family)